MLTIMERSSGNVIGFETDGTVTLDELKSCEAAADKLIEKYGKINWIFVWNDCKYENLKTVYTDMMWLLKNIKKFDRMAVVGDAGWKKWLIKADGLVFGEKYFDKEDIDQAWDYVEGK